MLHTLSPESWMWVGPVPRTMLPTEEKFEEMWKCRPSTPAKVKIYGKEMDTPRLMQSYMKPYHFSGMDHDAVDLPIPFRKLLWWAQHHKFPATDGEMVMYPFNQVLVNFYRDGTDYIGPHGDDEKELVAGAPIVSMSFGATRKFRIREKKTKAIVLDVDLEDGMCAVMGGAMQRQFTHEIVKINGEKGEAVGRRINVTIRQFK